MARDRYDLIHATFMRALSWPTKPSPLSLCIVMVSTHSRAVWYRGVHTLEKYHFHLEKLREEVDSYDPGLDIHTPFPEDLLVYDGAREHIEVMEERKPFLTTSRFHDYFGALANWMEPYEAPVAVERVERDFRDFQIDQPRWRKAA